MHTLQKKRLMEIARYLTGALIVAPIVGGVIGAVAALVFACVMPLASSEPFDGRYVLWVALTHGPVFGVPVGLVLGVVTGWPLRHFPPLRTISMLSGCTLAGAVPFCFMGPYCIMTALVGYAIGWGCLVGSDKEKKHLQTADATQ